MTTARKLSAYPIVFTDALDCFIEDPGKPFQMRCISEAEGKEFRLRFYGFRRAYIAEGRHIQAGGYRDIDALMAVVKRAENDEAGWVLEISHRDYSDFARRMAQAVEEHRKKDQDAHK